MAIYRNTISKIDTRFACDVRHGLENTPKTLPSKYFYDHTGSELFSKIMHLPEYYLTDAEWEIVTEQSSALIDSLELDTRQAFDVIELGAGDGKKTIAWLKRLGARGFSYTYRPIDISEQALQQLERTVSQELPDLSLMVQKGDYFNILGELKSDQTPKVVLFLGSNLGNMDDEAAAGFLTELSRTLNYEDKLVLGLDLQKSSSIILPAYNDRQGITSAFNLNLLQRINNELGADFDLSTFVHAPEYHEQRGIALSYLQSKVAQKVHIKAIETTIHFEKGEKIHTEISRKYNDQIVADLCSRSGFEVRAKLSDSKGYFADFVLDKS